MCATMGCLPSCLHRIERELQRENLLKRERAAA
jgi:hypothetical protein